MAEYIFTLGAFFGGLLAILGMVLCSVAFDGKEQRVFASLISTIIVMVIIMTLFVAGESSNIAEALGSAVDYVLFDSPEQASEYKERYGE